MKDNVLDRGVPIDWPLRHGMRYMALTMCMATTGCTTADEEVDTFSDEIIATPRTDCRNDTRGCNPGFQCRLNDTGIYGCLPDSAGMSSGSTSPAQDSTEPSTRETTVNAAFTCCVNGAFYECPNDNNGRACSMGSSDACRAVPQRDTACRAGRTASGQAVCAGFLDDCSTTEDCCADDGLICVDNVCAYRCTSDEECERQCCSPVYQGQSVVDGVCTDPGYCQQDMVVYEKCSDVIFCVGRQCDANNGLSRACYEEQCATRATPTADNFALDVFLCARLSNCDLTNLFQPSTVTCLTQECGPFWSICLSATNQAGQ